MFYIFSTLTTVLVPHIGRFLLIITGWAKKSKPLQSTHNLVKHWPKDRLKPVFPVSAVAESSVTAVTETRAETDVSLTAVTVAETDVMTNEACEIVFLISHASFYFYSR